ncbi:MAG: polyphosphate polymerase domain-containing protein [Defluviitaleaceae bacterium]|nr:polyphosphate polymerase domain-containing protein [Defluviitaleaceae bacterium]MCL2275826.1 polyphosphate polymerase domain-containing protein [Defluviitaleaceae bacterium]
MRYRYEHKYLINAQTAAILRGRASGIMQPDAYADENGGYTVNNVYLDDRYDSYYAAKQLGQYSRDKYRIRHYNNDLSFIRLERKHKEGILNFKETQTITREQYAMIQKGDLSFSLAETAPLWQRLANLHRLRAMRPTVAFAYRRETLTYKPGTVRLTFDSPLFDSGERLTLPPMHSKYVKTYGSQPYSLLLEVKYAGFLPEIIQRLLNGLPLVHTEMSKYAVAREQGLLPRK